MIFINYKKVKQMFCSHTQMQAISISINNHFNIYNPALRSLLTSQFYTNSFQPFFSQG